MTGDTVEHAGLEKDGRIAAAMASALPTWLFSLEGGRIRIVASNAAAMLVFGASSARGTSPGEIQPFPAHEAASLARIASTLPPGSGPRLHKLRLGSVGAFESLLCRCGRIELSGGRRVLLIEALTLPRGLRPPAGRVRPDVPLAPDANPSPVLQWPEAPAADAARMFPAYAESDQQAPRSDRDPWIVPGDEAEPGAASVPLSQARDETPLRFIFETDPEGRVTFVSPEHLVALGPATARLIGRVWAEAAADLDLDEAGQVERALARRETWSGLSIAWPFASGMREPIELSALPMFDDAGRFRGFRGLGVCRGDAAGREAAPDGFSGGGEHAEAEPSNGSGQVIDFEARTGVRTPVSDKPALSPNERFAFREIARALNARPEGATALADAPEPLPVTGQALPVTATGDGWKRRARSLSAVLDRVSVGTLVRRGSEILAANRHMLELAGCTDLAGLGLLELPAGGGRDESAMLGTSSGASIPVDAVLHRIDWDGSPATLLLVRAQNEARRSFAEDELAAILDIGGDGIVIADAEGLIRHVGPSAARLFGYGAELVGAPFTLLLAAESRLAALEDFEKAQRGESGGFSDAGEGIVGLDRRGRTLPLLMRAGRLPGTNHVALLFRDISRFREAESSLLAAKQRSDEASAHKSDFLAKISHEIRTPLNAIIGFAEIIGEERFGPIGTPRYREYLQDIRNSGEHVLGLVNDLLDLSKIEAGKLDLHFTAVQLNDVVQQCVAIMQPQSASQQIIVRTSLFHAMPPVVADTRSLRQIVLNLLSNAVKFTPAGGQVIIATALSEEGEAVLRVRDNGRGMSDDEVLTALEPFRQIGTSVPGGTGLGLPLTKALAEANQARFSIRSRVGEGTLVEVTFPQGRLLGR